VAGDVTGRSATITLPAGVSGTKQISAVTTMTDVSTDGFGHSSEFAADVQGNLIAAVVPGNPLLAATGISLYTLLIFAVALFTTGNVGYYISKRKLL